MFTFLLLFFSLSLFEKPENIMDPENLLLPKEEERLKRRIERVKDEASIEFLIVTTKKLKENGQQINMTTQELDLDDDQVLILVSKEDTLVEITAGQEVLGQISQSTLDKVAGNATEYVLTNKNFYSSIDRIINNITFIWLRDYYKEKKAMQTAQIAAVIMMAFWTFVLIRFSKAFDPYTKPLQKKWREQRERESIFGNRNPFW